MVKYLLVCNSSYSTYSFKYGTTSADFNAFGNVPVSSRHLLINDCTCIGLHRKSAHSLTNLPRIKSHPAVFLIFINRNSLKTAFIVT